MRAQGMDIVPGDGGGKGQQRQDQDQADDLNQEHHGDGDQHQQQQVEKGHRDSAQPGELLVEGHGEELTVIGADDEQKHAHPGRP